MMMVGRVVAEVVVTSDDDDDGGDAAPVRCWRCCCISCRMSSDDGVACCCCCCCCLSWRRCCCCCCCRRCCCRCQLAVVEVELLLGLPAAVAAEEDARSWGKKEHETSQVTRSKLKKGCFLFNFTLFPCLIRCLGCCCCCCCCCPAAAAGARVSREGVASPSSCPFGADIVDR